MVTEPVEGKLQGPKNGIWSDKMKTRDFSRELRSYCRLLEGNYKSLRKKIILPACGFVLSCIGILLGIGIVNDFFDLPDLVALGYVIAMIFTCPAGLIFFPLMAGDYYSKAGKVNEDIQRYRLLRSLSRQLAGECPRFAFFVDFRDISETRPYREESSPYSRRSKSYYNHHWFRITTISRDGIKLVVSSRRKVKMKGASKQRDMTSITFRFSFGAGKGAKLPGSELREVLKLINSQFMARLSDTSLPHSIEVDYPAASIISFTLKITGDSRQITPARLLETLGEFSGAIHDKYPEHTGLELQPLKQPDQT